MATLPETADYPAGIYQIETTDPVVGGVPNEATKAGLSNIPHQQLARRTAWLKARVDGLAAKAARAVTVGNGGNYATLNAALEALSELRLAYKSGGVAVDVRLLPGFVLEEQVIVDGINLGWIRIIGDDAQTQIRRSALTVQAAVSSYPAFCARNGGYLPIISQLFEMDSSGTAALRDGICVTGFGSGATVSVGCGVKRSGGCGIRVQGAGGIWAYQTNFAFAGADGILAQAAATAQVELADFSGAVGNGINAFQAATVNARAAVVTGCARGVLAATGARVNAASASARVGVSDGTSDLVVQQGGVISAAASIGGTSVTPNTPSSAGVIYK